MARAPKLLSQKTAKKQWDGIPEPHERRLVSVRKAEVDELKKREQRNKRRRAAREASS